MTQSETFSYSNSEDVDVISRVTSCGSPVKASLTTVQRRIERRDRSLLHKVRRVSGRRTTRSPHRAVSGRHRVIRNMADLISVIAESMNVRLTRAAIFIYYFRELYSGRSALLPEHETRSSVVDEADSVALSMARYVGHYQVNGVVIPCGGHVEHVISK